VNQLSSRHLNHLLFFDSVTYSNNGQVKCNAINKLIKIVLTNPLYIIGHIVLLHLTDVTNTIEFLEHYPISDRFFSL
jgi:hypothetical protein